MKLEPYHFAVIERAIQMREAEASRYPREDIGLADFASGEAQGLSEVLRYLRQPAECQFCGPRFKRTVAVENKLLASYSGKAPLPSKNDCLALALELGVPK